MAIGLLGLVGAGVTLEMQNRESRCGHESRADDMSAAVQGFGY